MEACAGLFAERHTGVMEARFAVDTEIFALRRTANSTRAGNVSLVSKEGALSENVLLGSRVSRKNADRGAELGSSRRDFVTHRSLNSALKRAGVQ